ncbi:FAD/FMN-containing dehydrogenase [Paenibacillus lutimineralis]|uniref:FAD/FMN-containing dehydrogenase n=1 Tax=Paenibacillus lutimineralis TaxID=2707005 RepID=A0A3Q9I999_9BACL|nr:FAD/FMN-containing dehydrogenase [Paenibacillus lutimineralis]AZS15500.1 FAD/FMN-containing dehydrogenase [Paenibacillus lutimineralis]
MKKFWIGFGVLLLVMGIGSAGAYAASANNGNNSGFFENMLPFAKQIHPDLSNEQIEQMYNNCNKSNGVGMSGIKRNSQFRTGMMNF